MEEEKPKPTSRRAFVKAAIIGGASAAVVGTAVLAPNLRPTAAPDPPPGDQQKHQARGRRRGGCAERVARAGPKPQGKGEQANVAPPERIDPDDRSDDATGPPLPGKGGVQEIVESADLRARLTP